MNSDDDTTFKIFRFDDDYRDRLKTSIIEPAWSKNSDPRIRNRAITGTKKRNFSNHEICDWEKTIDKIDPFDRAIHDLETVVGWELTRLTAPKPKQTRHQPAKRELNQFRSAIKKLETKINKFKQYNCLLNLRFDKEHRRNLSFELEHLRRALDQEIALHKTGQKKKPYARLVFEVARWMLFFEIEPKKIGNLTEAVNLVFEACGLDTNAVQQAVKNAWPDIRHLRETWPNFDKSLEE